MTKGPKPTPPPLTCYGCGRDWGTCDCEKKSNRQARLWAGIFILMLVTGALMVIS